MYAPLLFRFVAMAQPFSLSSLRSLARCLTFASNNVSYADLTSGIGLDTFQMKRTSTALQILGGLTAAAAAFALAPRPSRRFDGNNVVLITGGSRGLGLALAERFGRAGCRLILTARDVDELIAARYTLLDRGAVRSP